MTYRVLIVIKNKFYPFDDEKFASYGPARTHQAKVRQQYPKHDTAILAKDGRVLSFRESEEYEAEIAAVRKESKQDVKATAVSGT